MTSTDKVDTVTFRPSSRDARQDFEIPYETAMQLFKEGIIYGDATNGGFMKNPNEHYNVRKHLVPKQRARSRTRGA